MKDIILDASKRLFGPKRREYQAKIMLEYFNGNSRKAEREMGWTKKASKRV